MFIVFYNRISFIIHIQTYCRWTLKKYSERDILRDYGNCNNLRKCWGLSDFSVHLAGSNIWSRIHTVSRKKEFAAKQASRRTRRAQIMYDAAVLPRRLYLIEQDKITFKLARKTDPISCDNTE